MGSVECGGFESSITPELGKEKQPRGRVSSVPGGTEVMLERSNWETAVKRVAVSPPQSPTQLSRQASNTRLAASFNKLPKPVS